MDQAILNQVTRFCHWFQQLTGKTNFWLARWVCLVHITYFLARIADYWVDVLPSIPPSIPSFVMSLLMVTLYAILMENCRKIEDAESWVGAILPHWLLGWRSSTMVFIRVLLTIATIGESISFVVRISVTSLGLEEMIREIFDLLRSALMPTLIYLVAVDPLPPGTNKLSEFLKSFRTWLVPAAAPSV
jgi:hypothetical protein